MFDKAFRFLSQQMAHLEKAIQFRQNVKRTISLVKDGKLAVYSIDHGSRQAVILQYKVLMDIIRNNADTQFGREHGFSQIHSVEDYRRQVPLTDYDTFEPYIRRMMAGEKNLLTDSRQNSFQQHTEKLLNSNQQDSRQQGSQRHESKELYQELSNIARHATRKSQPFHQIIILIEEQLKRLTRQYHFRPHIPPETEHSYTK